MLHLFPFSTTSTLTLVVLLLLMLLRRWPVRLLSGARRSLLLFWTLETLRSVLVICGGATFVLPLATAVAARYVLDLIGLVTPRDLITLLLC